MKAFVRRNIKVLLVREAEKKKKKNTKHTTHFSTKLSDSACGKQITGNGNIKMNNENVRRISTKEAEAGTLSLFVCLTSFAFVGKNNNGGKKGEKMTKEQRQGIQRTQ